MKSNRSHQLFTKVAPEGCRDTAGEAGDGAGTIELSNTDWKFLCCCCCDELSLSGKVLHPLLLPGFGLTSSCIWSLVDDDPPSAPASSSRQSRGLMSMGELGGSMGLWLW